MPMVPLISSFQPLKSCIMFDVSLDRTSFRWFEINQHTKRLSTVKDNDALVGRNCPEFVDTKLPSVFEYLMQMMEHLCSVPLCSLY